MARNKMIRLVLLMAGFCLITTPATAEEEQFARMPWHLVDLWWDIGDDTPFESYSIEVTISDDIPSTKNLYIAPIGLGHLSKTPFYGGIQSQADGYTKKNQQLRKIGPGFLMSMWGERSLDAINLSTKEFVEDGRYMTREARQGIFTASDADRDGIASEQEYVTNRIITDEAKTIMVKMDADGDGKVAREEFIGQSGLPEDIANAVFAEFDTDDNGELLVPEYLRVWGRWARSKKSGH